ncbi:hypothetical protein M2347_002683 [Chryseobacterium sp. H1D6B]|uniref:hypothetical protein n=1 Tax=Chryseobacterium sp. H1D6B TaxID=2940588 RepID=UPI0015C848BB|nr:hypothetical protein [Chryseobacterium sp. H1D6B]MDH6252956.1 hypothetical protein [Chryseobacterium sp. H1D6B]
MITEIEQQTLDVDWFLTDGKHISLMASGGGQLPDSVAVSAENNEKLRIYFRNLPEISDVIIDPELDNLLLKRLGSVADERYLSDYVSMTKKGLYSFDKSISADFLDPGYHLVAKPVKPLTIYDLPQDISAILMLTRYPHEINNVTQVDRRKIE